jgi:predicted SnoaL-like aldol condensation-catalyzing enzyme
MTISWTPYKSDDPDHQVYFLRAIADGELVRVRVGYETIDDRGLARVRRMAEAKIRKAFTRGKPIRKVEIRNTDFQHATGSFRIT